MAEETPYEKSNTPGFPGLISTSYIIVLASALIALYISQDSSRLRVQ